jgi:Ca-activated chloride channel family protein
MDDKDLNKILTEIDAPEPDENAKKIALNMAMAEFDKKNQKNFKGNENTDRPIGITNNLWRRMMENKFKLSGTVAACAVLVLIGGGIITNTMTSGSNIDMSALGSISTVTSVPGEGEIDKETRTVIAARNEQDAQYAIEAPSIAPAKRKMEMADSAIATGRLAPTVNMLNAAPSATATMERHIAPVAPTIAPPDIIQPGFDVDGQDEFQNFKDNNIKLVTENPVSTFSIDVDTSSYSFMRRMIEQGQLPQKDAIRVEELINYFDYDYPVPSSQAEPFLPTVAVYDSPWAEDKKLMHIGIKGYELPADVKPRSNLVLLIDTSGSMRAKDKLPLLVNSFKLLLDTLNEDDTVAIVTYAGRAGTALEPTKVADKNKIIEALNGLTSGGSTAGAAGIKQAYALAEQSFNKEGVNRVILATDGDFNVGITNHEELKSYIERKRDSGISLSVLGFGQGNYHDNLMQTLAQNGNGNAAYIDSLSEARKVLVEEAGSTLFTIAKDVKIQVEFNPALVSEYRLIGYETRHLNREDFNNDKVDAGEIGAGHSVTAIYEITPSNSKNKMVDDLRYGDAQTSAAATADVKPDDHGNEYALLKMRYKLPEGKGLSSFSNKSTLITRPVTVKDEIQSCGPNEDCAPSAIMQEVMFASAVAGFGQLLRGGDYLEKFNYENVINMAQMNKGKDEFGYRTEFINLVRLAKSLK